MTEHHDDLDRSLSERLQASEGRVPAGVAPDIGAAAAGRGFRWPQVMLASASVIAAAVLVGVVASQDAVPSVGEGTPSPTSFPPTPTPLASDGTPTTSSPLPTVSPSAAPPLSVDLTWTQVAEFPSVGSVDTIRALIRTPRGILAVGTHYPDGLPILGPQPPREGRVWLSADGTTWEEVTPDGMFADAALGPVYLRADGSFAVIGSYPGPDGIDDEQRAWASEDGRSWEQTSIGLPEGSFVRNLVQGARGSLALIVPQDARHGAELWHSVDASAWERVLPLTDGLLNIGAGDEGFVVSGAHPIDAVPGGPFVLASADGREWVEATTPDVTGIAALGGDWYAWASNLPNDAGRATVTIWSSANGLDWSEVGQFELGGSAEATSCREWAPLLTTAGGLLFLHTNLTYPCSEGGIQGHGQQYVSADGRQWDALPLPDDSWHLVIEVDGRLAAAGTTADQPTFWVAEGQ